MLRSGSRVRRQYRLFCSLIPDLSLAGEDIRVSSVWENQLLCSNDGSVPAEKVSRSHLHPPIPETARFNMPACEQLADY